MKRQAMTIWRDANRLLLAVEASVRHFSRYHKYTLGSDLRRQALLICRVLSATLRSTIKPSTRNVPMWNSGKQRAISLAMAACLQFLPALSQAVCVAEADIPWSTPNSQLIDNGDFTVTDTKTGLMWKQCSEGQGNDAGCTGTASSHTWQAALALPAILNGSGGFAGYADWRLPDIKELDSLVEEACYDPSINPSRFPNTPSSNFWSASAGANGSASAWYVNFSVGLADVSFRSFSARVRLVRGGQ